MDGLTAKSTYKFYGLQQTLVRATTAKIICNFSAEKFNQSNARIHLMDSKWRGCTWRSFLPFPYALNQIKYKAAKRAEALIWTPGTRARYNLGLIGDALRLELRTILTFLMSSFKILLLPSSPDWGGNKTKMFDN